MMFLLRAAFWIAVVAAFAPSGLTGFGASDSDAQSIERVIATGNEVLQFCTDMPSLCEAGREATVLIGGMADATAEGVNHWLETRADEPAETLLADSGA